MNEGLFKIILAFIPVLGTIITYFVVPYIKTSIGTEKLAQYQEWATLAVKCAEMLWIESGKGEEKKAYVVDFLNNLFNKKKIVITDEQIEILIEAAVLELNKDKKD